MRDVPLTMSLKITPILIFLNGKNTLYGQSSIKKVQRWKNMKIKEKHGRGDIERSQNIYQ